MNKSTFGFDSVRKEQYRLGTERARSEVRRQNLGSGLSASAVRRFRAEEPCGGGPGGARIEEKDSWNEILRP